jgi:hypothetical protein
VFLIALPNYTILEYDTDERPKVGAYFKASLNRIHSNLFEPDKARNCEIDY